MRCAYSLTLLLAVGASSPMTFGQSASNRAADEAAIKEFVTAFIGTREDSDAASLSALLTPDVDQQVTSGRMRSGREAVVDGSLTTTRNTGGRRTITLEKIRFLSEDVAIADGPYDIVGRSDGPDRHYRTSIVLARDGDSWRIAAIRNMQPVE